MAKDEEPTAADWEFILELKGVNDEETGDVDFRGCLKCIKKSYEHLTALKGVSLSDAGRLFLQRGLNKFLAYEIHVGNIRRQKIVVEKLDANSIYAAWFQKNPDFALIGKTGERLHFETDKTNKKMVKAIATVLGLPWQQFVQVLLLIGMLGSTDIPLAYYREVEENAANFHMWLYDKINTGDEYVEIVEQRVSGFKIVEKRLTFEDILGGKKLLETPDDHPR